jgi:hypothetical protein
MVLKQLTELFYWMVWGLFNTRIKGLRMNTKKVISTLAAIVAALIILSLSSCYDENSTSDKTDQTVDLDPVFNQQEIPIQIGNPGFETGSISSWWEWHPDGQASTYGVDSWDAYAG